MQRKIFSLSINGEQKDIQAAPDMPLLWALRDKAKLTGTKYGCGVGLCGACTVLVDGAPMRSCSVPIEAVEPDAEITTIEGLAAQAPDHPVLKAWQAVEVPQCGYCQSGQILAAAAFLKDNPSPTEADVRAAMANICRCGTYNEIVEAISLAAKLKNDEAR